MTTTGDLFVNMRANTDGLRRGLQKSQRDIQQFSQKTEKMMSSGVSAPGMIAAGLTVLPTMGRGLLSAARLSGLRGQDRQALKDYRRELKSGGPISPAIQQRRLQTSAAFRGASGNVGRMMAMVAPLLSGPAVIGAAATVAGIVIANNAAKWSKRIMDATQEYAAPVAREKALIEMRDLKKSLELAKDPANQSAAIFNLRSQEYRRNSGEAGGVEMTYAKAVGNYAMGGVSDVFSYYVRGGFPGWLFRTLFSEGGVK